jgi:hypothetical protein
MTQLLPAPTQMPDPSGAAGNTIPYSHIPIPTSKFIFIIVVIECLSRKPYFLALFTTSRGVVQPARESTQNRRQE